MTETEVTLATLAIIERSGWRCRSVATPRFGAGWRLRPDTRPPGGRNAGDVIPDVIATKDASLLLIEAKDHRHWGDVEKLRAITLSGGHSRSLGELHRELGTSSVQIGIAWPAECFDGPALEALRGAGVHWAISVGGAGKMRSLP